MRNIRQNLFLAFVYNSLGVPIAAGVLYPWLGWLLNPMIAAAAMPVPIPAGCSRHCFLHTICHFGNPFDFLSRFSAHLHANDLRPMTDRH